uniref:AsIV-cont00139-ORF1 n=1 Tax=Apophua simplicipes ichnovirus TaxID=1329648 RepID=S5DMQ9_9VIRU|nr:AsIV-cont00139-ORF1 [Apophua simplicipes ichnovirus]
MIYIMYKHKLRWDRKKPPHPPQRHADTSRGHFRSDMGSLESSLRGESNDGFNYQKGNFLRDSMSRTLVAGYFFQITFLNCNQRSPSTSLNPYSFQSMTRENYGFRIVMEQYDQV